jgi:hypothetical protein
MAEPTQDEGAKHIDRRPLEKPDPLTELAERIKSEHSAIVSQMSGKGLVPRAIKLAEDLIQAKDKAGHGNFLKWLDQNCKVKKRTAQRYMRLVEHRAKIDAYLKEKSVTMTLLSLNEAFKLTAEPKPEEQQSSDGNGENQTKPDPVKLSDEIDKLVDALIAKLKVMKADKPDNAEAAASELVEKLELLDLLPAAEQQKKAA